jgi:hypothetical protein
MVGVVAVVRDREGSMSEMIERVKAAITADCFTTINCHGPSGTMTYVAVDPAATARRVIEAMREPTEAMVAVVNHGATHINLRLPDDPMCEVTAQDCYRAMIDAALGEPTR